MKRKFLSIFLIIAILASSLLAVSCGTLDVDRPQTSEQTQEQVQDSQKQEEQKEQTSVPEQKQEDKTVSEEKQDQKQEDNKSDSKKQESKLDEKGSYTSKEDVALYLWTYKKLPSNFMTKKEAQNLGWSGGGLDKYAKGMCIGGDKFGNREGLLPKNHSYYECDIDTLGAKERGAKRIVFADDYSLIYYTEDHYSTFELLYGKE